MTMREPGNGVPGSRWQGPCWLAVALAAGALLPSPARAASTGQSGPVITYFCGGDWRVFDPLTREDFLFGSIGGSAAYWDTAGGNVEYLSGNTLFRVRWEMRAQPWPLLLLPARPFVDWWFNPDSACWQAMTVKAISHAQTPGERPAHRCRTELWQSNGDGTAWHIARVETTECTDSNTPYPGGWRVPDPPGIRRRSAIGFVQLQDAMTVDAWGGKPEPIAPPKGESISRLPWFYIPFRSVPGRGLALRIGQRPSGLKTFMVPFYLMDRRHGTQRQVETPTLYRDQELWRMGMEERDGFLLVSGIRTFLFDLNTGEQILPQAPDNVSSAVWIKRPAPATEDSLGLRRLRARFR